MRPTQRHRQSGSGRLTSSGARPAAVVIAGLVLSGCGSDDNLGANSAPAPRTETADCSGVSSLTAEGATSQQNAIALFNQAWTRLCPDKNLSYNPTSSGASRQQFIAGNIDIAGSDSPLSAEQAGLAIKRCAQHPAWHLPLMLSPIVLAYHLDGVEDLVVSGPVLAGIFNGTITDWSNRTIAELNPGRSLPKLAIEPIYRSDSSGTTDNFQRYLMAAAPRTWPAGAGSEFQGEVGEGVQPSAGVVQAVQSIPGAIGYLERGIADRAGLRYALIDSRGGGVAATDDAVRTAIESVAFTTTDRNDLRIDLDALYASTAPHSYPLVQVSYEIVCSGGYPTETAAAVRSFLSAAATSGQEDLSAAGYVPLPQRFTQRLISAIAAIR